MCVCERERVHGYFTALCIEVFVSMRVRVCVNVFVHACAFVQVCA